MLAFFFILCAFINCKAKLQLLSKSCSLPVYHYVNYASATISNYKVPADVNYVSFHFIPTPSNDCGKEAIYVNIRFGSLPIVDPEYFGFPNGFVINNQRLYYLELLSNKKQGNCVNITSPFYGHYFVVAYRKPQDPRYSEPNGTLRPDPDSCKINLTTLVYVQRTESPLSIKFDMQYRVFLNANQSDPLQYNFFKPPKTTHAKLTLRNINFPNNFSYFLIKLTQSGVPHSSLILYEDKISMKSNFSFGSWVFYYWLEEGISYGINFFVTENISVTFNFDITQSISIQNSLNTIKEMESSWYEYYTFRAWSLQPFQFFFNSPSNSNVIDLKPNEVVTLLFVINDGLDVGGTLSFHLTAVVYENQVVVVCINNTRELPIWPNLCVYNNKKVYRSPMVLNQSVSDVVVQVPYPLPGIWYATFTLICVEYSNCPGYCKIYYQNCKLECIRECENSIVCSLCFKTCESKIKRFDCVNCTNLEISYNLNHFCTSEVKFTLASYSCSMGTCANGGKCMQKFSQGLAYSVCICSYNFRGWTCSNDRFVSSQGMIHLRLFLLLSSALIFLLDGYIAFKRKFYEESAVYTSKFISMALNHLCDSGQYWYNLCITEGDLLSRADIYCGVLAIWVTFIAMAYLRKPLRTVFHIIGAVLIAYCVLNNMEWLYIGLISFETLIVIINWAYINIKFGVRFPSKFYSYVNLPVGIVLFCLSILSYDLLQTPSNFMYLHFLLHILLGLTIIILLPNKKIFLSAPYPYSSSTSRRRSSSISAQGATAN